MGIFSILQRKPKKRGGKRSSPKKEPKTMKQLLNDAFLKELRTNPQVMRKVAYKEAGYPELSQDEDTEESAKKQIKGTLMQQALSTLKNNPEMMREYANKQLEDLMGARDESEDEDSEYYHGSPIQKFLSEMKELEELKESLGSKNGSIMSSLLSKEVIVSVLDILKNTGKQVPESRYLIIVNGEQRFVTETEYKQLASQGVVRPVVAIDTTPSVPEPEAETASQIVDLTEPEPDEPKVPEIIETLNLENLMQALDMPPDEVASQLMQDELKGQILISYLNGKDYDTLVKIIMPYKTHSKVGKYATKLLDEGSKEWVVGFLNELIKYQI